MGAFLPRETRTRAIIGARAVTNEGRSSFDCQIRNMSPRGAKLTLPSAVGLPPAFLLEIPSRYRMISVEVRWRTDTAVGAKFRGEPGRASD
jgi:hypothetical protein